WRWCRRVSGGQISEDIELSQVGSAVLRELDHKQTFVDDMSKAVHDAGSIKIETSWRSVLKRIEAGARREGITASRETMAPQRFEKRVARRYPFEIVALRRVPVCRETRIPRHQGREFPTGIVLALPQGRRRPPGIERMRQARDGLQRERGNLGALLD